MNKRMMTFLAVLLVFVVLLCVWASSDDDNGNMNVIQNGKSKTDEKKGDESLDSEESTEGNSTSSPIEIKYENKLTVFFPEEDYSIFPENGEISTAFANIKSTYPVVLSEGYDELKQALEEYKTQIESDSKSSHDEIKKEINKIDESEYKNALFPWKAEYKQTLVRGDETVLSFWQNRNQAASTVYSYVRGYSFDSQTGQLLNLKEIATDYDGLCQRTISDIENFPSEYRKQFYSSLQDRIKLIFHGNTGIVNFVITQNGIQIAFNPDTIAPKSLGIIYVDIPYEESLNYIDSKYLKNNEKIVINIEENKYYTNDFDCDENNELLFLKTEKAAESNEVNISIEYGKNKTTKTVSTDCDITFSSAYVMRNDLGKWYLFVECLDSNSNNYVYGFDLSNSDSGAVEFDSNNDDETDGFKNGNSNASSMET